MAINPRGGLRPNAPQSGWSDVTQTPGLGLDGYGRAVQGYTVRFRSGKGVPGELFIPLSRYTPDNVRAEIAAHAAQLDAIQEMSG